MEMTVFNVIVLLFSTEAAIVSAVCAYLARKPSRRDMVDTLNLEILRVVSTIEGRNKWRDTVKESYHENSQIGASIRVLIGLLGLDYQEQKWILLLSVVIQELKNEGNDRLLGMQDINLVDR